LADVPIHDLPELTVGFTALAHLVEFLSALHGVEPPRKHIALSAIVALPKVRPGFMIDHADDIDRQRVEGFDPFAAAAIVNRPCGVVVSAQASANERKPAPFLAWCREC